MNFVAAKVMTDVLKDMDFAGIKKYAGEVKTQRCNATSAEALVAKGRNGG